MSNLKRFHIFIIVTVIMSLCGGIVSAEEDTATLSAMIGTVELCPAGTETWKTAAGGITLSAGDKIRTGIDGMASIVFTNGSTVTLKQDTEFVIQSLNIAKNKRDIAYRLQLTRGKLRAIVEELGDGSFEIKTPTAVAAVRGTVFYLDVREVSEDELPPGVEERLMTQIFVEEGGVIYTNTFSGKYYTISPGQASEAYGNGSVSEPLDVPEDKQQEWQQGWEDILAAEPYQDSEGDAEPEPDTDTEGEDGAGDDTGGDRQSDIMGDEAAEDYEAEARKVIEKALEAAARAGEASDNALAAAGDIDSKKEDLGQKENEMNSAYNAALTRMNSASDSCDTAGIKTQEAQQALNDVGVGITEEANKTSDYVIVDITALNGQFSDLQTLFNTLSDDVTGLGVQLDNLIAQLGNQEIENRLQAASAEAAFWSGEAENLAARLIAAATNALIEGNDATMAAGDLLISLTDLIEMTLQAIDRANDAADNANQAALEAEDLLASADVPALLAQMDGVIDTLQGVADDSDFIKGQLQDVINIAEGLMGNADGIKDDLLGLINAQLQHERDVVWQEMNRKLCERVFLRQEVKDILQANQKRRVEGYIEKISDAQMGKVLRDIHGNRVRVEQYILRPEPDVVELLNVNLRTGDDLTTMAWTTRFNQSLDILPTGQLKTLPWDSYLDTCDIFGSPYILSPYQPNGIYPNEMRVEFSHNDDGFAEGRRFKERKWFFGYTQEIYDRQLWVKNFNDDEAMNYAKSVWSGEESRFIQLKGTYSIDDGRRNATIGGEYNNPKGFEYGFKNDSGTFKTIEATFYVISDDGVRQDYGSMRINDVWDALRVNMGSSGKNIGSNNLEMMFSSAVFSYGPIDLIYVPTSRMEWKNETYGEDYIPDYSLHREEPSEEPPALQVVY